MTAAQQPERDIILALFKRIGEQPEFKEAFERLPNAERNYIAGDFYNIITSRPHTPAPETLPDNYWHCPFKKGCEDGESWCEWPCEKWAIWHDAQIAKQERERV